MEVGTALRRATLDLLGVGLDDTAAGSADRVEHAGHRDARDAGAAVALAGEDAPDAPARQLHELLGVGRRVLDVGQLVGGAVLAPPDALVAGVDQDLVDRPVAYVRVLRRLVAARCSPAQALDMEAHAPAAAPHAVVGLDEPSEVVPGVGAEQARAVDASRSAAIAP